jgi:predicted dehydrogenase
MAHSYTGSYRAGIIGHTGRGEYGHGLDVAFIGLPGVEIVAVADPDEQGRARVQAVTGAVRGYADYREMLGRERLDLVAVGPRWLDQRLALVVAAAEARVKAIYCEKPFARSLDEADRMLAACEARGVKIAVAHQNRVRPAVRLAQEFLARGTLGRLRMIRTFGKQDRRGGGQDLLVLGTHLLDLMRFFAGDARWCHARVTSAGRDATAADVRPAEEEGGLVAGDDILAQYGFDGGVTGAFESTRSADGGGSPYLRTELCGTSGLLVFWNDTNAPAFYCPRPFALPGRSWEWDVLQLEPLPEPVDAPEGAPVQHAANQALVGDLLAAAEADCQPISSGHDARAALEMILAVYESHCLGNRVLLPLAQRDHPLTRW